MDQLWTEKYRPKRLEDVINQKHIVERLKVWVKDKSIPNMLFAGPPGVGKTTLALCLAYELFGEHWRDNFQETNASDERGIDVVRGRIKEFAKIRPLGADFKIIFLDESDALTPEAQQALRRTMERFSGVCRFILSCNYSSRLIEPIQSRTAVFRFKELDKKDVVEYVDRVAKGESLNMTEDGREAIADVSKGDLRMATNVLQATSASGKIDKKAVYDVVSKAKPEDVNTMINLALNNKFGDARKKLYDMLITQGLSGEDIIREIHSQVFDLNISEEAKLDMIEKIGEFEFRLNQGGSPEIQLEALLSQFLKNKK